MHWTSFCSCRCQSKVSQVLQVDVKMLVNLNACLSDIEIAFNIICSFWIAKSKKIPVRIVFIRPVDTEIIHYIILTLSTNQHFNSWLNFWPSASLLGADCGVFHRYEMKPIMISDFLLKASQIVFINRFFRHESSYLLESTFRIILWASSKSLSLLYDFIRPTLRMPDYHFHHRHFYHPSSSLLSFTTNRSHHILLTVSGKKVNLCIKVHNFHRQCRILTKFRNSNATSNGIQITKFQ